jgi:sugar O-acyltransferase (sialic acid O-acetyltransferase NeuD family)
MPSLVLIGGGGHAISVAEVAAELSWTVVGHIALSCSETGLGEWLGPSLDSLPDWLVRSSSELSFLPAVGDNFRRMRLAAEAVGRGYTLSPPVLSPTARVSSSARFGAGSVVMPGAIVRAYSRVGEGSIVNSGAILDHHCLVEEFCHIAPGAVLAGRVRVRKLALVGLASCILPDLEVGARAVLGAGSVLLANVEADSVCMGIPARCRRDSGPPSNEDSSAFGGAT